MSEEYLLFGYEWQAINGLCADYGLVMTYRTSGFDGFLEMKKGDETVLTWNFYNKPNAHDMREVLIRARMNLDRELYK